MHIFFIDYWKLNNLIIYIYLKYKLLLVITFFNIILTLTFFVNIRIVENIMNAKKVLFEKLQEAQDLFNFLMDNVLNNK